MTDDRPNILSYHEFVRKEVESKVEDMKEIATEGGYGLFIITALMDAAGQVRVHFEMPSSMSPEDKLRVLDSIYRGTKARIQEEGE